MKYFLLIISIVIYTHSSQAQVQKDTIKPKSLQEILIKAWLREDINRMPDANNGLIAAGKKNEVIALANVNANIAEKTGRQIFAKIPGVFVYDMDGSGNQVNVSTRGLDAHRSWENNIRQNMVLVNSDMYGYPASHYSAPMESVERIEIIRSTASLQSGAQFGGLINYVTKKPDTSRSAAFESINTVGSFGLFSTYNAISGTVNKKFSYYAYYYRRHSDSYRKNSISNAEAQFVTFNYRFNKAISLKAELGRSKYIYKIPGPLTDSMFYQNPKQSTRSRNYFSPDIYIPSLTFEWIINNRTTFNITSSGVFGKRNSLQFDAFANIPDSNERGGFALVPTLEQPIVTFKGLKSMFEYFLEHEITVSNSINELVDLALNEKDYATHNFLQWYVSEQIEEERSARVLNDKLELIGDDKSGLYLFDRDIMMTRQKSGRE